MTDKHLHIIAFNIPFPPNYGGIIDIYFKIRALHRLGVGVILHCFEYERPRNEKLEEICEKVYYYRRLTGLISNFSTLPYNVYSRRDKNLINNLLQDDYPILFEGLHSCFYLNDRRLQNRFKIYREANIEHDYYFAIGNAETNPVKKTFHYLEALKFRLFQRRLKFADLIMAISQTDATYLQKKLPRSRIEYFPAFQGNDSVLSIVGSSRFLLYHGKLSVKENEKAALWLIKNIFSKLPEYKCVIAGMNPSGKIVGAATEYKNIELVKNPGKQQMDSLVREAQINLLVTFQATGLKLKLLNSLFAGRHVVVNPPILAGSGLDSLCHIADSAEKLLETCRHLMQIPFTEKDIEERRKHLFPTFSDEAQGKRIVELI